MKAKETAFLKQLMEEQYALLYRYAMAVFHDARLAEELTFDTFHEAAAHITKLMQHENPTGWLVAVLKNKMGDRLRWGKRQSEREMPLSDELTERLPDAAAVRTGGDAHLLLLSLPELLPPEDHRFFSEFLDGAAYSELAERYGLTVWSCRKRIQRIRDRLRDEFPEYKK